MADSPAAAPAATRSIIVNAPAALVFGIVTDFASYPKFQPEMESVKVLKKSAGIIVANFTTNLIRRVNYTCKFRLKPPKKITWELVEGDAVIRKNSGSWTLKEIEKGVTELTFSVSIEFGIWMPKFISDGIIVSNLPAMLMNFKKKAERKGISKSAKVRQR